jgi:mRNA-degrading endonuclease RelE of RelBE toxin-antitoxin system
MKYDAYLSPRAKKQYKRFDAHIRHKIRTELLELEEDPYKKGSLLQGVGLGLRYIKKSFMIVSNIGQYMIWQKTKKKFWLSL